MAHCAAHAPLTYPPTLLTSWQRVARCYWMQQQLLPLPDSFCRRWLLCPVSCPGGASMRCSVTRRPGSMSPGSCFRSEMLSTSCKILPWYMMRRCCVFSGFCTHPKCLCEHLDMFSHDQAKQITDGCYAQLQRNLERVVATTRFVMLVYRWAQAHCCATLASTGKRHRTCNRVA